jgi:hypothetical protein
MNPVAAAMVRGDADRNAEPDDVAGESARARSYAPVDFRAP